MSGRRAIVLITLLVVSLASSVRAQSGTLPDGCERSETGVLCQWQFDTRQDGALFHSFSAPFHPRTLATMTVVQEGVDGGWEVFLVAPDGTQVDEHAHTPRSTSTTVVRTTHQALVLGAPEGAGWLNLSLRGDGVGIDGVTAFTGGFLGPPSAGAFSVTYAADTLPPGESPIRPAATRDDPHLVGPERDARRGAYDQVAAWFDDAFLGDGLFEAHVAARDLSDWDWREGNVVAIHVVEFRVLDVAYYLSWNLKAVEPTATLDDVDLECSLMRILGPANYETILRPACAVEWENGILTASIPERSVGSPGDGAPFTSLRTTAKERMQTPQTGYSSTLDTVEDQMTGERYAFALGGPAIWDGLNPRLAVPPPVAPAWYEAPLAKENVPDTLQVVGAFLAALTFLFGIVAVRKHRRQTRELLARVDALTAAHEREAREGLLALGTFEAEVTGLYRANRLSDAQYQMLTQRISAAAARLALRHGLGLDDGAPGDPTRRVPVEGARGAHGPRTPEP